MNNELLATQSERLKKDVSNTINYWFGLNMLDDTRFSKQAHKQLKDKDSRQYKNLYNALDSDVSKVYSMNGIGKNIEGYSAKYEKYFDSFNQKLNDFSRITVNKIIGVIETGLQGTFNAKRITDTVQVLMTEREGLFEEYFQKNIGQLENYMLLLTGAESGDDEYLFISEGSGACDRCGNLDNEIFKIEEAGTGINYPPIHPNCKCKIKIIKGFNSILNHNPSLLKQVDSNDLLSKLPYIDRDVERIEEYRSSEETLVTTALNPVYPESEIYGPLQWEALLQKYTWAKITPPTETTIVEDDDDIEPFLHIPLEERTKFPYAGYEENNILNVSENLFNYNYDEFKLRTDIKNNNVFCLKEGEYADLTQISAYNGIGNSFIASESYQINSASDAFQRTILFAYDGERNVNGVIVSNGSCSKTDGLNKWGYKVYTDSSTGLRMVEVDGKPLICVAVPGSYGEAGDIIRIKTDMGYIDAIIGDAKGNASYYQSNWSREDIPNEDGSPVSVIEFIYDNNYWGNVILANGGRGIKGFASPNASSIYESFKCNAILEIANFGSIIPDGGKTDHYLYGDNIPLK